MLAAIGSSVGLGNVWRFPALAFKFGGGAFFLPYLLSLFIIGIPVLLLELALGQLFRSGDVVAFSRISKRLRGLGLSSVYGAFIVNTYYVVLLSWIVIYFCRSFSAVLPWTVKEPLDYFNQDVLHTPATLTENPQMVIGATLGTVLFQWILIYFCLWKGVELSGKIAYVTMTLPIVFIIVLFFRGITLPGAALGIRDYIGVFDSAKLQDPLIWSEAVGQIFFSIGIAFGTMTAYASYNTKYQNTTVDSVIIACSNSVYEFFCGFVVFSVVGYLREKTGKQDVAVGGFGLAFSTYPVAFSTLPAGQFWCILFFLTLYVLGLDSAFSLVEGGVTVFKDSRKYHRYSRKLIVAGFCVAGFMISILFCTEMGIQALDAVDYFLNNIAIVFVGVMECVAAGYMYDYDRISERVGQTALWIFASTQMFGLLFGVALATINIYAAVGVAVAIMGLGALGSLFLVHDREMSLKDRAYWIYLGPIESLREDINANFSNHKHSRVPFFWSICIKFLSVPILFIMFCIPFIQMTKNDPNIPKLFRWVGILISSLVPVMIITGLMMPKWYEWLLPENYHDSDTRKLMEKYKNDTSEMVEKPAAGKDTDEIEKAETIELESFDSSASTSMQSFDPVDSV